MPNPSSRSDHDPDLAPVHEFVWYLAHWSFTTEELREAGLRVDDFKRVTAKIRENLVDAGFVVVD